MAAERTERLINLVICLLHTRSYITAERLREIIPGYGEAKSDDAFKRMFERDKEDLRDLGIPLETGTLSHFEDEIGYRIARSDYALPELTLEPDEAAAVALAARMWTSASLGAPATRALRKLEAAGVEVTGLPEGLQPRAGAGGTGFPTIAEAAREGKVVTFDYRGAHDTEPAPRRVEPWGVVWWHGRWYLVGKDADKDAPRVFRLSRIASEPETEGPAGAVTVPPNVDLTALVAANDPRDTGAMARVKVRHDHAIGLRRQTIDISHEEGWDIITVPCPDPHRLAEQVLAYGPDAVLLSPAEAREAVVRRLKLLAESDA
ncbi:MAG: WYL domain-containing protein [Frankiaceae bacterium]|nr:WYL domain-containing protein [Frankiaceae bacterium]